MKILFINGSPNKEGNTSRLAKALMGDREYEIVDLTDYRINVYGQSLPGDQFGEVLEKVRNADVLVMGSPLYWHNICGSMRTFIDRFYGAVDEGSLKGKMYFLFQGAAPEKWMLEAGEYTMKRFAGLYGLSYQGMATSRKEAEKLGSGLEK